MRNNHVFKSCLLRAFSFNEKHCLVFLRSNYNADPVMCAAGLSLYLKAHLGCSQGNHILNGILKKRQPFFSVPLGNLKRSSILASNFFF
jgi:hypothetical protein